MSKPECTYIVKKADGKMALLRQWLKDLGVTDRIVLNRIYARLRQRTLTGLKRKTVTLNETEYIIVDEADPILNPDKCEKQNTRRKRLKGLYVTREGKVKVAVFPPEDTFVRIFPVKGYYQVYGENGEPMTELLKIADFKGGAELTIAERTFG